MNFLSKKARMNLVAKTLVVTSVLGVSTYIIGNQKIINAYATDLGSISDPTSIAYKNLQIKNRIVTELQKYNVDITFSASEVSAWSLRQDTETMPKTVFYEALDENPDIFWVAQSVVGRPNADGSYTLYANNLYENAVIDTKKAELKAKVDEITANLASYSQLRKEYEIHDYINENCTYDKNATGTPPSSNLDYVSDFENYVIDERAVVKANTAFYESHNAYGALIDGKAVCEGYAKSAMMLFKANGMDSGVITSDTHGWNYVQIGGVNGNYYQIDLTWDDAQDKKTLYPYKLFNVSNDEMQKEHAWTSNNVPSCTDTTYDNLFRTVGSDGKTISGKPMVRVEDKLYYIKTDNKLYSCDLDTTNQSSSGLALYDNKTITIYAWNLIANNNCIYLLHMSSSTNPIDIKKIDITNNAITSVVNISKEFNFTYNGTSLPDFYISNNKIFASVDGTTYKEFSLDGVTIDIALEQATDAVIKAESSNLQADVDSAKILVTALSDGTDKSGLNSRLDAVQQIINTIKATDEQTLITNATALVVKAEGSNLQSDVTSAKALVDALTDGTVKTDLLNRLSAVQQIITNTINEQLLITNATTLVTNAEGSKLQADVDNAKSAVDALTDGTVKTDLLSRLSAVQQVINDAVVAKATDAVAKAETSKLQENVDDAKALVVTLPNGSVKDGLNNRLDAVQKIIDDAVIAKATDAVAKAEASKLQADVDGAKALVSTLPDGSVKDGLNSRLNAVQQVINDANTADAQTLINNATALVVKAEGSKLQADVDGAKALVDTIPNGSVKDGLNSRLNAVQQIINNTKTADEKQKLITDATALVTKAESSKTQADVDSARALIATMPDGTDKTNLLNTLDAIQKAINDALVVKATDAVVKAEASKLQADVDDAKTLVGTLPDGSVKDGLNGRLNVVQKAITDSKVVNPTDVKISGIAITGSDSISDKGGTLNLTTVITPSTATSKTVTWTSSNDSIASVSSSGLVTATGNGTATITATANDGSGVIGTKVITVSGQATITTPTNPTDVKVTGIAITGDDSISAKSGTITLVSNISPSSATNKTVEWSSSDTNIANVSSSGVVTATGNGTVSIKATANDGSGVVGSKTITITGQTTTSSDSVLKSVSISGTEEVGHTLKTKVSYEGTKPSVEYQWQRASSKNGDYSDINGATDDTYKLKSSDKNKYIRLVVTTTNNGNTYTVEDTTGKIDRDTSDDEDDNTSSNSSDNETSNNNSNNTVSTGKTRPSMPSNTNSISPADGTFTDPSGRPVSGWISSNGGKWYYLNRAGVAQVGWVEDNGKWYYLNPIADANRATMKTGWIQDNGKWYYLASNGAMVSNTTIDGYKIGSDGAWIG